MWSKFARMLLIAVLTGLPLATPAGARPAHPPIRPRVTRFAGPFNTRQQAEKWGTDHKTGGAAVFFATNGPGGVNGKWWFQWEQIT